MSQAGSRDQVDLSELIEQFYGPPLDFSQLGTFTAVSSVPSPYDQLLDHNEHMTVTVEAFHGEPVDVHVHKHELHDNWYSREITLVTQSSRRIVQYGIVRLNTKELAEPVWRKIESREIPLGRVLIEHNVLREVQLCGLWKVIAGPCLADKMHQAIGETMYGRTALIYCDGQPAIELLEIVAPV
ncbi:hypothetical protein Pla22_39990 [Rubripirellula amarantea]|uniref:Uncharacterized protein n=1 Tax=Rubripirellula amarantea TaxID=2527999 RepID=A0A5C5WN56_9BACT|nr:hypothetical protein [Rubripirellula amarantea]TWT51222.1 hypothetical protein Pla22_39990 [Rubripirellula amarantea]